jgi:hypothetical protein
MRAKWMAMVLVGACVGGFVKSAPAAGSVVRTDALLDHVTGCTGELVLIEGVFLIHGRPGKDASGGNM